MAYQLYRVLIENGEREAPRVARRWGISLRQAKKKLTLLAIFVVARHLFGEAMPNAIPRSIRATVRTVSGDMRELLDEERLPVKKAKEKHLAAIYAACEKAAKRMRVRIGYS